MYQASDGGAAAASTLYRHPLLDALIPVLTPLAASRPRRRGGWGDLQLALCLLLMGWSESRTLGDRFAAAHDLAGAPRARSYQGFSKALRRRGGWLVGRVRASLAAHLRRCAHGIWTTRGWCVFAVDGSRFDAPRTRANRLALGTAGREGSGPQMLATVLVHLGTSTLWNWRIAGSHASERAHLRRLFRCTPRNALIVADAGFVGYECLREVVAGGRHVLVRLAGNARLISGLDGRPGVHALWPKQAQGRGGPLLLRVIRVRDGVRWVTLGTSVLEPERLSEADAAAFYRMRWGAEVCYRSLKQTLDRRKMRSAAPRQAELELHASLLSLMALGVLTLSRMGRRRSRERWSVAGALRLVRRAARAPGEAAARRLLAALRGAVMGDNRRRSKRARDWPHKKTPRPPGPPVVRTASACERARYAKLRQGRV